MISGDGDVARIGRLIGLLADVIEQETGQVKMGESRKLVRREGIEPSTH